MGARAPSPHKPVPTEAPRLNMYPSRHIRGKGERYETRHSVRTLWIPGSRAFGPIPGGARRESGALGATGNPGGDQVGGLGPRAVGFLQVVIGLDELQRLVRRGQRVVQGAGAPQ